LAAGRAVLTINALYGERVVLLTSPLDFDLEGHSGLDQARGEFRHGWRAIVAGLIGNTIFALPPYSAGLFMAPLQEAFGWSRTAISLGLTLHTLAAALGAVLVGVLANRIAARRLITIGLLAFASGFAALALVGPSLPVFWSLLTLMALVGVACSPLTLSRIIVVAFDVHRGVALGLTMVGPGLAAIVLPLVMTPLIAQYGWRWGYSALALFVTAALVVMVMLLRSAPTPVARTSTVEPAIVDKLASPAFLALFVTFLSAALAVGGAVVHFVPMLLDARWPRVAIAPLASLMGASVIVSRLLTGWAVDRFPGARVAMVMMGLGLVGFLVLWSGGATFLPGMAVVVGLTLGAELDLVAYLTSRHLPKAQYGRAFGVLFFAFQLGLALSPALYAAIHDTTGAYGDALLMSAAGLALSVLSLAALPTLWPERAPG